VYAREASNCCAFSLVVFLRIIRCCIAQTGKPDAQRPGQGMRSTRETAKRMNLAETHVHQVFIEGGLIRKLWSVETDAYRDHLLRLDAESRRNRFAGAIADDMVRTYAATTRGSDVIVHGFFVDGVLRGPPICTSLGRSTGARPRPPSASCWRSLQLLSEHGDFNEKHRPETVDLGLCTL
jgi:hypothetical protein